MDNYKLKLIVIFSITLFLSNTDSSFAQGPNAPEAASFEPVDATDMVNLVTGDFTYVLPLLNVPSPEGGYPIALSYHAGIAMDQESSWVGLGWNINPGAINRNINGAPDDYLLGANSDFFYSNEETITHYNASIGYSWGTNSVGLGLSWGSNKSLGGSVSIGFGIGNHVGVKTSIGTNGVGLGVNAQVGSLTFGVNTNSGGSISGSAGFNSNGSGFSISSTGDVNVSMGKSTAQKDSNDAITSYNQSSIGINFSSGGVSITARSTDYKQNKDNPKTYDRVGGSGIGMGFLSFNGTVEMGDYNTESNSWQIPIAVPIGVGFLNLSFGKSTFKYSLYNFEESSQTGPVHFNRASGYKVMVQSPIFSSFYNYAGTIPMNYTSEQLNALTNGSNYNLEIIKDESALDVLELPVAYGDVDDQVDIMLPNPEYPSYDKFNVQAQGLSGSITPRIFENGALYGFSNKERNDDSELDYLVNNENGISSTFSFKKETRFYFENEISTYLETPISNLNLLYPSQDIIDTNQGNQYSSSLPDGNKAENVNIRKTSNYVEYYTNREIATDYSRVKSEGYIGPVVRGFNPYFDPHLPSLYSSEVSQDGIRAFKITAIDGKTYHYALPVYNHEIVQRTYGTMEYQNGSKGVKPENEAYFEKKQLEPYATHWLLTTITGPDFIDVNSNGLADKEDYGYWVNFEYGKYSNGFAWSTPYGKEVIESTDDENVKTWIKGRKDIYYLDRIGTRTHTAYFVKSERFDNQSEEFKYDAVSYAVDHTFGETSEPPTYQTQFTIPSQTSMKLDKIVLVKNEDGVFVSQSGYDPNNPTSETMDIKYKKVYSPPYNNYYYGRTIKNSQVLLYNKNNIIDVDDNFDALNGKIIKSISFNTDYSLANGSPNSSSGRLTLNSVSFNGKNEASIMPSYRFNYINSNYTFNIDDQDDFGYKRNENELWSLNEITTPTGAKIKIQYEDNKLKSVIKNNVVRFKKDGNHYESDIYSDGGYGNQKTFKIEISNGSNFGIMVGEEVDIDYLEETCASGVGHRRIVISTSKYNGKGMISSSLGNNSYEVIPNGDISYSSREESGTCGLWSPNSFNGENKLEIIYRLTNNLIAGGIRVKRLSTVDQNNYYNMEYKYGKGSNDYGYITYLPYAPEIDKELPYSSELPPAKVMYDHVETTTTIGKSASNNTTYGLKSIYEFNVLKEKTEDEAKFGSFYELISNQTYGDENSNKQIHEFIIKDNLASIGQLMSVETYNVKGQQSGKIENTYYSMNETPDKLGVVQESYQSYKKITDANDNSKSYGISSTRVTYPNLLKHSTEYKSGYTFTSRFDDLDPITGQAKEIYSFASNGIELKTKSIQAFRKYAEMGSKAEDINNKNMLSQITANYSYVIDPFTDEEKIMGASITTWNKNWEYKFMDNTTESSNNVWRKYKTYVWDGETNQDGTYSNFNQIDDDGFIWGIGAVQTNPKWKQTSEITMYDQFSAPIETKDINGNHVSRKKGGGDYSKIIAICNAPYDESYYSGAEFNNESSYYECTDPPFCFHVQLITVPATHFDGQVKAFGHLEVPKEDAHTGTHIVRIGANQNAFEVKLPQNSSRTGSKSEFKVSVWAKKGAHTNAKIKVGTSQFSFKTSEEVEAGEWVMLNGYIPIPSAETMVAITSSSGLIDLDDFRLHPVASSMTSYVYNEWDELTFLIGANNLATCYIYDTAGRLKETWVEVEDYNGAGSGGFKRVSENDYNYKRTLTDKIP